MIFIDTIRNSNLKIIDTISFIGTTQNRNMKIIDTIIFIDTINIEIIFSLVFSTMILKTCSAKFIDTIEFQKDYFH